MRERIRCVVGVIAGLACVALVCSCATTARQTPVRQAQCALTYTPDKEMEKTFGHVGGRGMPLEPRPKRKPSAEPVYVSRQPAYGMLMLGDAYKEERDQLGGTGANDGLLIAAEESRGTGAGYDTLYVDANNNGDLTDDAPLTGKPNEYQNGDKKVQDWRNVTFDPVEVAYTLEGTARQCMVKLQINAYGSLYLQHSSSSYWKGVLTLGKESYDVALIDDTCNGRFSDPCKEPKTAGGDTLWARGDTLLIDLDGDHALKRDDATQTETFRLGKYVLLGGRCFEIEVTPAGDHIALNETKAPLGTVALRDKGKTAYLLTDDGVLKVAAKKAQIPAGAYRLLDCSSVAEAPGGQRWCASGEGRRDQKPITVNAGKTTEVVFGAPIKVVAAIAASKGREYKFSLSMLGRGGESYTMPNITKVDSKESSREEPAKVQIKNEKGEVVASGDFEYG